MQNPTGGMRALGIDPLSGKQLFAVTEPGSRLDVMADGHAIKAAAALVAVTGTILENGGDASELVPDLYSALSEMVEVAARHFEPTPLDNRVFEAAARALGEALRGAR
ncbi:hypothetical protein ACFYPZ_19510 [Streptomyces sp. NPDC005506]|uniref:hypothetical protein n=1 Tax=Streptomyces sp. NPDC005506 TaxID=3364718 RepID=UPI0036B815D1